MNFLKEIWREKVSIVFRQKATFTAIILFAEVIECKMRWQFMIIWKEQGRKQLCPILAFTWKNWGKSWEDTVRIA